MAYEWKLTPRPYTDQEAKTLLTSVISPETTDWHYNTHHKGYVTALNNIEKGVDVLKAIERDFGSLDAWKADFKATGISAKLSGWALLVYDALWSRRLLNVEVDEHQYGAIWGGVPLIACDVFEHASYHKDGPGRAKYIDNFLGNLHWGRINDRFKKFVR